MAKIGVNERKELHEKVDVGFIIIDNKPHLNENGINYLCHWIEKLILVTTNTNHIAFSLKEKYNAERITVQSSDKLNGLFLRENLIDYVNIVIAPLLVRGHDTSTLIDREAISKVEDLNKMKALELIKCNKLNNSYVQLV